MNEGWPDGSLEWTVRVSFAGCCSQNCWNALWRIIGGASANIYHVFGAIWQPSFEENMWSNNHDAGCRSARKRDEESQQIVVHSLSEKEDAS